MNTIIGLSGYAGAGKDTVGAILVEDHGFTRFSFAAKLYELAEKMNPLLDVTGIMDFDASYAHPERLRTILNVYGSWEKAKREVPAVREYLQRLGNEIRNVLGLDTWVEAAFRGELPERIVVTDCRYPNEVERIGMEGGFHVRIKRLGVGAVNGHISEHALDDSDFDYTIDNSGSIDDLKVNVARMLGYLGVA